MPILAGFLNPTGLQKAFLIPIFSDRPRSNQTFIQKIDSAGNIRKFVTFELEEQLLLPEEEIPIQEGDPAIWAFQDENNTLVGSQKKLAGQVGALIRNGALDEYPFLKCEALEFCEEATSYHKTLKTCFSLLKSFSEISADIWRDHTILTPQFKKEFSRALTRSQLNRNPGLVGIRLVASGSTLDIHLPSNIFDASQGPDAPKLARTTELSRVFNIKRIRFERVETDVDIADSLVPPNLLKHATMKALSGTGVKIAELAPSNPTGVGRLFHPQVTRASRNIALTRQPAIAFTLLNSNIDQIERAIDIVSKEHPSVVRIAIMTSPVGFGTKRDPLKAKDFDLLRRNFDCVFVVGNHRLNKPTSRLVTLQAGNQSVAFAKTCIAGVMQLVWNSESEFSRRFFRRQVPEGFAIVGKSARSAREPYDIAIDRAFHTMPNENFALSRSRRVVVIGSNRLPLDIKRRSSVSAWKKGRTSIQSLPTNLLRPSNRIIALAFGIDYRETTPELFTEFCASLIQSLGWETSPTVTRYESVRARLSDTRVCFVCFSDATQLERSIKRFSSSIDFPDQSVFITNFTPSKHSRARLEKMRVPIFHYSRLQAFTEDLLVRGQLRLDLKF